MATHRYQKKPLRPLVNPSYKGCSIRRQKKKKWAKSRKHCQNFPNSIWSPWIFENQSRSQDHWIPSKVVMFLAVVHHPSCTLFASQAKLLPEEKTNRRWFLKYYSLAPQQVLRCRDKQQKPVIARRSPCCRRLAWKSKSDRWNATNYFLQGRLPGSCNYIACFFHSGVNNNYLRTGE